RGRRERSTARAAETVLAARRRAPRPVPACAAWPRPRSPRRRIGGTQTNRSTWSTWSNWEASSSECSLSASGRSSSGWLHRTIRRVQLLSHLRFRCYLAADFAALGSAHDSSTAAALGILVWPQALLRHVVAHEGDDVGSEQNRCHRAVPRVLV